MFEKGRWYRINGYHGLCVRSSYDGILRLSRKYKFFQRLTHPPLNDYELEVTAGESLVDFDFYTDDKYITESDSDSMETLEEMYMIKDEIDSILRLTYESIINYLRNKKNECR